MLRWFLLRWRRWRCTPRHAFTLHATFSAEDRAFVVAHLSMVVQRANRTPWRGYPAQELLVTETRADRTGDGRIRCLAHFARKRGGWNRTLTESGALIVPRDEADLFPLDEFAWCFPCDRWAETPTGEHREVPA